MDHETTPSISADTVDESIIEGCTTCLLSVLAMTVDPKEASDPPSSIKRLVTTGDPKTTIKSQRPPLWSKKDTLWVSFQPGDTTKGESKDVPHFELLSEKMLDLMKQWTVSGAKAQGRSGGANLEIKRFYLPKFPPAGRTKADAKQPAKPDITVEIRNRPKGKTKQYNSLLGTFSAEVKDKKSSIYMDFGDYGPDELAVKDNEIFFKNQILHEFGHALGFLHEHFQKEFQETFFKEKTKEEVRKQIIATLKRNSVFAESKDEWIMSEVLGFKQVQNDKNEWVVTTTPIPEPWKFTEVDLESVMMYPFGYTEDNKGKKQLILPLSANKNIPNKEIKRVTKLSVKDLEGASKAYYFERAKEDKP